MNDKHQQVAFITLFIDVALVYILFTQKLSLFENIIVYTVFFIHLAFVFSLINGITRWIDILHVVFFFYMYIFSLFLTNSYLIMLFLSIMAAMICYWINDNECPFGKYETIPVANQLVTEYPHYVIWTVTIIPIYFMLSKLIDSFTPQLSGYDKDDYSTNEI